MEGKQFRDLELDIQMHIEKCRTCSHGARAFWFRKPARKPQRMELAAAPSSPVLPQRCPSPARPSTATVESDPAASVLQATPRPVRKYTAAAVVACPLQQRIDHLMRHGECAEGYPWATPRQLEGRSVFEAFVVCMQSGRGQQLSTAAVAAALLMARHGLSRKLACDHCKIPEGGSRSRVGTLAKQLSYVGRMMPEESAWPELPSEWVPPPPATAAKKTVVQRYAAGWQAYMQLPEVPPPPTSTSTLHLYPPPPASTSTLQAKQMLDGYDVRQTALKDAALSPGGTHRVHVLQQSTPAGGVAIVTYRSSTTPADEPREARNRRMSATRERSRQAFKMLEWRLIERAHPDGIKKRRRTLIAALPRERKEFLDRELARNPQLLDHEPRFLDDLAHPEEGYYEGTKGLPPWYTTRSMRRRLEHGLAQDLVDHHTWEDFASQWCKYDPK